MSAVSMLMEGFTVREILDSGQKLTLIDWLNFLNVTGSSPTEIEQLEAEIQEMIEKGLEPLSQP